MSSQGNGGPLTASVTVQIQGHEDEGRQQQFALEVSREESGDADTIYFEVLSAPGAGVSLTNTSGSIILKKAGATRTITEFVTFAHSTTGRVRHPAATAVSAVVVGASLGPTPAWDGGQRMFIAETPTSCVLKVTYSGNYSLYEAIFAGQHPPIGAGKEPMVVVGTLKGDVKALALTPPPFSESSEHGRGNRFDSKETMGSEVPRIRMEIDPNFPPQLIGKNIKFTENLAHQRAFCVFRVFPIAPERLVVSSGTFSPASYDMAPPFEDVEDVVTFSGKAIGKLKYQPFGAIGFTKIGRFYDVKGKAYIDPNFVGPGEVVKVRRPPTTEEIAQYIGTVPEFFDEYTLEDDEVAITQFGIVAYCYGIVRCTYTIKFATYFLEFGYRMKGKRKDFTPCHVVALHDGAVGTLKIDPPSTRGRK